MSGGKNPLRLSFIVTHKEAEGIVTTGYLLFFG
jgi:hypothetical protein